MSDLDQFLLNTGRTLSQMALYAPEHPSVKGSIAESFQQLTSILAEQNELVLSMSEGKLVVNGKVPESIPAISLRPFIQLLTSTDLHSLSFISGVQPEELVTFFRLTSRNELKNSNMDAPTYMKNHQVTHIKCNLARYAKVGEDETVGGKKDGAGGEGGGGGGGGGVGGGVGSGVGAGVGAGAGGGDGGGNSFAKQLENLSLNDMIRRLVQKSVDNPTDQGRVVERVMSLVKTQIDESVNKVVKEFSQERTKLTNERERTEGVVEQMADGVVVVDQAGNVIMMNPAAENIYGVKLGECLGKPLSEGVRSEQMLALAKDMAVPSDRPIVKEVELHGSEDARRTLRASTAAVQDTNGRVVGMVSVLSDVTKQKELTRMQNEFMANVTHDLRAPIHAVKLSVGAILEGAAGQVTAEQNKMLSMANRNIDRLSRLINDLLDFSKIESGKMEIHPEIIEVDPLLAEAAGSMESWSKSRGISMAHQPMPMLPPVYADSDRVLQIVNNLISNAIKFTPVGGRVTLSAEAVEEGGKAAVAIHVQDTGPGITKEDQARIFQRFVQLKQTEKHDIRGTGLGLSICRAFVDLHKGRLWITSPPPGVKNGTQFSFTLPAVQRSAMAKPAASAPVAPVVQQRKGFWKKLFGLKSVALVILLAYGTAWARPHRGTVRRVIDPNTLQLDDGTRVRFLGIDGPLPGSAAYAEAMAGVRFKTEGKEVLFDYGVQDRDADGIWEAYVYADGDFVNEALVRDGLALVSPLPNEESVLTQLLDAEREARRAERGLWKDSTIEPYSIRAQKLKEKRP